jgi:hypothetical protein
MTGFILRLFGDYTEYQVPGSLNAAVYCRVNRPGAQP